MKQEAIFKRFIRNPAPGVVGNQRGQAVIEYVLLMVVVVSLILGLRGVFTSMNNFMSDYMGEYVVCLMEYGELPTLGVQNADLKKHTDGTGRKCEFRKVSGATSFGAAAGGSGPSGGSAGPSSTGSKKVSSSSSGGVESTSTTTANKNSSSNKDSSSGAPDSASGSSSSSRSSKSSRYASGRIQTANSYSTADAPQSGDTKKKILDDDPEGRGKNRAATDSSRSNQRRSAYQNGKYIAITGGLAEQLDKQSKMRPRKPSSSVLAASEEGYRFVPTKRTFNPPRPELIREDSKDDGFNFGDIMKWLIIAGIVIACFILFGGQIMNYSNSDN